MGIMTSPALADIGHGIAFRPSPVDSLVDTGIDTNEELDASETAITMDADASSAIAAGNVIHIEAEDMLVTSVVTVTVNVERGYANSDAATHTTDQDVLRTDTASTVLWLPGQDDAFSSTIRDRSGFGNDGTITGATWMRTGKGLWYLNFDAVDDVILISAAASLDNIWDGGGTVICWIRGDSVGESNVGRIFNKSGSGPLGWGINVEVLTAGVFRLRFLCNWTGDDGLWVTTDRPISAGVNTFVAVTYNADSAANKPTFYIDDAVLTEGSGIAAATPTGTREDDSTRDLFIGDQSASNASFDGMISLPRIIAGVEFTAAQIESIRQQERGFFGV